MVETEWPLDLVKGATPGRFRKPNKILFIVKWNIN